MNLLRVFTVGSLLSTLLISQAWGAWGDTGDSGESIFNTVMVNSPTGYIVSGVSGMRHPTSGTTIFKIDASGNVTCYPNVPAGLAWQIFNLQARGGISVFANNNRVFYVNATGTDLSGNSSSVTTPTDNSHAVNKKYHDDNSVGSTVSSSEIDWDSGVSLPWVADVSGGVSDQFIGVNSGGTPVLLSPASAREALSLVPGTDVQVYDADTAKTDTAQQWSVTQTLQDLTANSIQGGISKYPVETGTTLTGIMLAGGAVYWMSATPGGVSLPAASGNTMFALIKDAYGAGVTIFAQNNGAISEVIHEEGSWGNSLFLPGGNMGGQIAITSVDSGASQFWDVIGKVDSDWVLD